MNKQEISSVSLSEESSPVKAGGLAKVHKMGDESDVIVEGEVTIKDLLCIPGGTSIVK